MLPGMESSSALALFPPAEPPAGWLVTGAQSSGVSRIFSATSLNASLTPTAVFADVSIKREFMRRAKASPSGVDTCRENSYKSVKKVVERRW